MSQNYKHEMLNNCRSQCATRNRKSTKQLQPLRKKDQEIEKCGNELSLSGIKRGIMPWHINNNGRAE